MKNDNKQLTYISLFSSAGVGCYGFKMEHFKCIATAEFIERRLNVQKHNDVCDLKSGYIVENLTSEEAKNKILTEIKKNNVTDLDVLISTPPCQGMSVANHKKKNELGRNSLVVESIKLTKDILPKFFVFENVRAFLKSICTDTDGIEKTIQQAIKFNLGKNYNIHCEVINFKDYGNPSSRTRTLVIGVRKDLKNIHPSTLMPDFQKSKTLREVIGKFPSLQNMGDIHPEDIYHNFRSYKDTMLDWIKDLREGQSAFDNKDSKKIPHRIIDGKIVYNTNKNGDKYSRCYWNKVAPCIHTRNDILASQATIHPEDNRVFSIRELMELMSVPRSFRWSNIPEEELNRMTFEEKRKFLSKEEINIRQSLGEAVPTVIFHQISKKIKHAIDTVSLDLRSIKKIIKENKLTDVDNLLKFLKTNTDNYTYTELSKIAEFANAERLQNAAFYTDQDICYNMIKDLPESSNFKVMRILEPSVGVGNFLPLLIEKYASVQNVTIDVIDIDNNSLAILKVLLKKIFIPKNIKINFICTDFLLRNFRKKYDLIIGNPPFGKVLDKKLLNQYRVGIINKKTTNIFSFFLEKSLQIGDTVALIVPKSILSTPEFNDTRKLLLKYSIKKIADYGEKGFKGVKIETVSLIIEKKVKRSLEENDIIIESFITGKTERKKQSYITDEIFPYWLLYRNNFFDRFCKKLNLGVFTAFRDRSITKKSISNNGKVRVLKSRNIGNNRIINISGYDAYINSVDDLAVGKFLNKKRIVIIPNLSYNPRATFLPKNSIADGSVAMLVLKDGFDDLQVTKKDLSHFNTEDFSKFYRIARNYGTRSLNIDSNSVFFWGIPKK